MKKSLFRNIKVLAVLLSLTVVFLNSLDVSATTNRQERRLVGKGNELFRDGHYLEAGEFYQQALKIEPGSKEALYNLGLTYIRRASAAQSDSLRQQLAKAGAEAMQAVAQVVKEKPNLAADAIFNLGNLAFNSEDYAQAVEMYKQSLRIRPEDEKTRRNLRIAQKKLQQNQDQDQNQDQNKDQDQNQDEQQNQDQQQQDQQQNQDQQQQQPEINPQAAEQILQALENKENQTRARVNKSNNGQEAAGRSRNTKRW
ncbi:MAG: tetratricopeptide repeat protein [Muribaculaceae bacterium]|nr:tetratricopeptide repeat protein [Muribaculaceae bacterium]